MRKIAAAVMFTLIAGPALAQDHVPMYGEADKDKTESQKADDARAERAYQRSLSNVPAQKAVDPWGAARGDDATKKPAATAKPATKHSSKESGKTKNGSAAN